MQIEDARLFPKKVVVKRSRLEAVVQQRRHNRVDLVLQQHEIAHHHVHAAGALRHRDPAAKAERRRRFDGGDGDAEIVARDVDLEHLVFVIARVTERREHLLVLGGNVLRPRSGRERQ
jgi:hypothetical protein